VPARTLSAASVRLALWSSMVATKTNITQPLPLNPLRTRIDRPRLETRACRQTMRTRATLTGTIIRL